MPDNKNKTPNIKKAADKELTEEEIYESSGQNADSYYVNIKGATDDDPIILYSSSRGNQEEKAKADEKLNFDSKDIKKKDNSELFIHVEDAEKVARAAEQRRIEKEKDLSKRLMDAAKKREEENKAEYEKIVKHQKELKKKTEATERARRKKIEEADKKQINADKELTQRLMAAAKRKKTTRRREKRKAVKEAKIKEIKGRLGKIRRFIKDHKRLFMRIRVAILVTLLLVVIVISGIHFGREYQITKDKEAAIAAETEKQELSEQQKADRTKQHYENIETYKDDYVTIRAMAYMFAEDDIHDAMMYMNAAIDVHKDSSNKVKANLYATRAELLYGNYTYNKIKFTSAEEDLIISDAKTAFELEPTPSRAIRVHDYAQAFGNEQLAKEYYQKYEALKNEK